MALLQTAALPCPEDELLLAAARSFLSDDAEDLLINPALNWGLVGDKAEANGILPVLMRQIERGRFRKVPPAELERLRIRSSAHELRTLLLARELIRLLDILETQGIKAIPFKGPALASFIYGDPAMRRSDDLDLIIRGPEFWRVSELLECQGFRRHPRISREQMSAYARSECDMTFEHGDSSYRVEVHWAIVPPYHGARIPAERLWDHLETVQLLGRTVPTLSAGDHLTALCLHACKHLWRRLEWVCGICALIKRVQPIDWDRAFSRAQSWGSERVLLLGLLLARELTGMNLPAPALARLQAARSIESVARKVWAGLFREEPPGLMELTRFRLELTESGSARIRYCLNRALQPSYRDLEWIRLARPLHFLYFFLRPVRLTAAWVSRSLSRRVPRPAPSARRRSC